MVIRKGKLKHDAKGFISVYREVFSEPPWNEKWPETVVMSELIDYYSKNDLNLLVALAQNTATSTNAKLLRMDSEVIGFSVAYCIDLENFKFLKDAMGAMRLAYGDELAVLGAYRNNGIATAMMESREQFYRKLDYDGLIGRTDINGKMVKLYEKLGFKNTGIQDPVYKTRYYFLKYLDPKTEEVARE